MRRISHGVVRDARGLPLVCVCVQCRSVIVAVAAVADAAAAAAAAADAATQILWGKERVVAALIYIYYILRY